MVRWCARCWQENPYSAQRCERCGAELRNEAGDRVERLLAGLNHPLAPTRRLVAVLLGRTRDPRALGALAQAAHRAVEERDWALLDGVVEGLAEHGSPQAVEALAFISQHGYTGARKAATAALQALQARRSSVD